MANDPQKPKPEPLHEIVLRSVFLADTSRPVPQSSEDVFWRVNDPTLQLAQLKEVLEWLVRRGDMDRDLGKYVLARPRFFELKEQYRHLVEPRWRLFIAPIAPIKVREAKTSAGNIDTPPPVQVPIGPGDLAAIRSSLKSELVEGMDSRLNQEIIPELRESLGATIQNTIAEAVKSFQLNLPKAEQERLENAESELNRLSEKFENFLDEWKSKWENAESRPSGSTSRPEPSSLRTPDPIPYGEFKQEILREMRLEFAETLKAELSLHLPSTPEPADPTSSANAQPQVMSPLPEPAFPHLGMGWPPPLKIAAVVLISLQALLLVAMILFGFVSQTDPGSFLPETLAYQNLEKAVLLCSTLVSALFLLTFNHALKRFPANSKEAST